MLITFLGNFRVDYCSEVHHKKTLESLGHEVIALQETVASSSDILENARRSDLFVWVHTHDWETPGDLSMVDVLTTLKELGIPTMTYHLDLWMGLNRQQDLERDEFYKHIGHFFTVDPQMASWFNEHTNVIGHYLPAGVYEPECEKMSGSGFSHDIIFTGSKGYHPEWPYRPQLINWLRYTYGDRFQHFGNDGLGVVRGTALNWLYQGTKIVVGDTLCPNFSYAGYFSDRLFEVLGRGGFMIFPYISGIEEFFVDRKHLVFYEYGNFEQLKSLIDYYLVHDEEREAIRWSGFKHVKENHTYTHRWKKILEEVCQK